MSIRRSPSFVRVVLGTALAAAPGCVARPASPTAQPGGGGAATAEPTLVAAARGGAAEAVAVGPSLRGLVALDEQRAFAAGSAGTVWCSDDGGQSHRPVGPAGQQQADYRDVELLPDGALLLLSVTEPARVLRSDDRGGSWQVVFEGEAAAFFDAFAVGHGRVVVLADPPAPAPAVAAAAPAAADAALRFGLFVSDDGGREFRPLPAEQLPPALPGEHAFAASGTCLVALPASHPHRFAFVTGGSVSRFVAFGGDEPPWVTPLPLQQGTASRGAFALAVHGRRVVVVGGDHLEPELAAGTAACSDDGGRTFRSAAAGGYRSAVVFLDASTLFAVGPRGASWSIDGGRRWLAVPRPRLHTLARAADGSLWGAGADGQLLRLLPPTNVPGTSAASGTFAGTPSASSPSVGNLPRLRLDGSGSP